MGMLESVANAYRLAAGLCPFLINFHQSDNTNGFSKLKDIKKLTPWMDFQTA
jgi:hypothetical protein